MSLSSSFASQHTNADNHLRPSRSVQAWTMVPLTLTGVRVVGPARFVSASRSRHRDVSHGCGVVRAKAVHSCSVSCDRWVPPSTRAAALRIAVARASSSSSSSSSTSSSPDGEQDVRRPASSGDAEGVNAGLKGYPGRNRLSLAFDQYSRMALPTASGFETQKRPPSDILWGFLMCFVTIAVLCQVDMVIGATTGKPFMIGAWGTISVLAFGAIDAPVLRVWNAVVATTASSFIIIGLIKCFGAVWWVRALGIATAVAFMMWSGSIHPPAAAAAMAAVERADLQALGFVFVVYPTIIGSLFIMIMGQLCAKLKRKYEFNLSDLLARDSANERFGRPKAA